MTANVEPMIAPDPVQMRAHVAHLFEGWLDGCHEGCVELAWSDARDGALRHAVMFGTDELDELVERAVVENRKPGQNVYIGQALRRPDTKSAGRGSDADFFALTSYYADVDDDVTATASINYRNRGCPPTAVVITGRQPHVRAQMLWRLKEPERDSELARAQNAALAYALGGDKSVVNPGRVLRLGGSIAWPVKLGRVLERTEFLTFDDRPKVYLAGQIARAFPPLQAPIPAQPAPSLNIGTSTLSADALLARIRAGEQWHNNTLRLVGHWIARGFSDAEILGFAEVLTLPGYAAEDTRRDLARMIAGGRAKWAMPNVVLAVETVAANDSVPLEPVFLDALNLALLPRRRWLLGRGLLRERLTLLVAPPGVGKSTHSIARAVALASGREITGESVHESVRCWIYNTEDEIDELKRRLGAVLQHFSIPWSEVKGRIALNSGADRPLLVARADANGMVIRQPDVDACIERIREHNIGLFVVDPFVETHEVNENSNEQIKSVAAMFREIARKTGCAVLLVHHTAKPPQGTSDGHAGNMNTARGASAMLGVARVVQTLFGMSEKDAEKLGVSEPERHLYIRLDDGKANLSFASSEARWFRRVGVEIANGDEVGVLEPCEFTNPQSRFTVHNANEILTEVQRRFDAGTPFSHSARGGARYLGHYLAKHGKMSRKAADGVVIEWLNNGVVTIEACNRKTKLTGLKVLRWL